LSFNFPDISTEGCPFAYTYSVEAGAAAAAITFDGATQAFDVFWITDLTLSGDDFIEYTVTVSATVEGSAPV